MKRPLIFLSLVSYVVPHAISAGSSVSHREHKVHNIVLYPDKHSWCKTTPIKQVITHPGCKSAEMDNNVCVGACFSYSIPKTQPEVPGEVLPYCDSCQPSEIRWKHITLECPDREDEEDVMTKRVEIIDSCACASCVDPARAKSKTDESEDGTKDTKVDVPELMTLMMETHNTRTHHSEQESNAQDLNSERVVMALKHLDENQSVLDLEVFRNIKTKVEVDHKVDSQNLQRFLEKMKTEKNVEVDSEKLKYILESLEHRHHNHSRHHRVPGPHHSLVYPTYAQDIAADMEAASELGPVPNNNDQTVIKIDVASHHLTPAHDGVAINYQDNNILYTAKDEKQQFKDKQKQD